MVRSQSLRHRASGTIRYRAPESLLHTDAQTEVSIAEMISGVQVYQTQERLTDLAAKFTRAQEQLDEVSVFGVNFQDVSESVDASQTAIVV